MLMRFEESKSLGGRTQPLGPGWILYHVPPFIPTTGAPKQAPRPESPVCLKPSRVDAPQQRPVETLFQCRIQDPEKGSDDDLEPRPDRARPWKLRLGVQVVWWHKSCLINVSVQLLLPSAITLPD